MRGVWMTDDFRQGYDFAEIYGVFPWNRHLVVETTFFDVYTPDERVAAVAREMSLAESYYRFFASMLVYLAIVTYLGIVAAVEGTVGWNGPVSGWPYVPGVLFLGILALGVWYGRQKVYRADFDAAKRTDVETVISTLEKLDDEKASSGRERGKMKIYSVIWTRPSPSKRIEHLRKRSSISEHTVDE